MTVELYEPGSLLEPPLQTAVTVLGQFSFTVPIPEGETQACHDLWFYAPPEEVLSNGQNVLIRSNICVGADQTSRGQETSIGLAGGTTQG